MIVPVPLILLASWGSSGPQCLPVSGERIRAGDMARTVPAFAGIAPELDLGNAPAAGGRRIYAAAELARLARRYGLAVEPGVEACFERHVETLTAARIKAALDEAMPNASIEVVEFSRQPVPPGVLRFPASELRVDQPGASSTLWRGWVSAPGRDDFAVWAKVRIRVSGRRTIATTTLRPDHPIDGSAVREEPYEGPPGLPDLGQVVGRVPRQPIPAGTVIESRWLKAPAEVVRGEPVLVEIQSGRARLILEAEAQATGRRGDVVAVRNPANGKVLRVTVADRGRAWLAASAEAPSK